jgi:hypothetical protein
LKGPKHVDDYTSDDKRDNAIAKIATWLARDGDCCFFTHEEQFLSGERRVRDTCEAMTSLASLVLHLCKARAKQLT